MKALRQLMKKLIFCCILLLKYLMWRSSSTKVETPWKEHEILSRKTRQLDELKLQESGKRVLRTRKTDTSRGIPKIPRPVPITHTHAWVAESYGKSLLSFHPSRKAISGLLSSSVICQGINDKTSSIDGMSLHFKVLVCSSDHRRQDDGQESETIGGLLHDWQPILAT